MSHRTAAAREDPAPRPAPHVQRAQAERLEQVWKHPKGWRYWSDVNNTEVGVWYTAAAFAFMLFGGVLALLMRLQLATPANEFLSADTYNQVFTLHGTVMMFLFAVPIFEAVSIMFLPEMLGARGRSSGRTRRNRWAVCRRPRSIGCRRA